MPQVAAAVATQDTTAIELRPQTIDDWTVAIEVVGDVSQGFFAKRAGGDEANANPVETERLSELLQVVETISEAGGQVFLAARLKDCQDLQLWNRLKGSIFDAGGRFEDLGTRSWDDYLAEFDSDSGFEGESQWDELLASLRP